MVSVWSFVLVLQWGSIVQEWRKSIRAKILVPIGGKCVNGKFPKKCVDSKFSICLHRASIVSYSFYIGPNGSDRVPAKMVAIVAFATGKIQYRER